MKRLRRIGLLLALASAAGCAAPAGPEPPRHALLICLDTVRYDVWELVRRHAPPPEGSAWSRAIHLGRAQSTAPWTLPAVSSVLTGLYPSGHGAGRFQEPVADFRRTRPAVLEEGALTLPERLRSNGFATRSFTASGLFRWAGFEQGFDRQELVTGRNSRLEIAREVGRWLDQREREGSQQRFFLYLHFMEAHVDPMKRGPERRSRRMARSWPALDAAARSAAPANSCGEPGMACERWLEYVAAVWVLRDTLTDLLADLERRGLLAQTVIALYSDHGEEFLDHEELARARGLDPRNRYGRGHGHTLFQELLHVPLVFWHPALPGRDVAAPASLADVTPTLLDWLGLPVPPGDGVALGPVLAGGDFDAQRPLYSSGVAYGPRREAVVRGERKRLSGGGRAPDLEFELASDPREEQPAAPGSRDLDALLAEYRSRHPEARAPAPIDPQTLRALQELGYLEEAEPSEP